MSAEPLSIGDAFCREYEDYVRAIARNVHRTLPKSVDYEDLVQEGFVGLLDARARWSSQGGASFKGFAWFRIRGAIVDSLRRSKLAPDLGAELDRVERADDWIEHATRRGAPTANEAAQTIRHVITGLVAQAVLEGHEDARDAGDPRTSVAQDETADKLRAAVDDLTPDLRDVVHGLYFEGLSMGDLARRLGRNKSTVCRAHRRALELLRHVMQEGLATRICS